GVSLGILIQDGNYALKSEGGTVALNGVPDLSLSASGLQVEIEQGLDPNNSALSYGNQPTDAIKPAMTGGIDLTTLASGTYTQVQGMVNISVASFVSLSGTFSFTESVSNDSDMIGKTTKILVGASDVDASIGTEDSNKNLLAGVHVMGA